MQRIFTRDVSHTQIRSIFRAARFGDRTRCPGCGYARKLWQLEDDRWRCGRCRKRFGLLTDTWLSHTRFELAEVYELLFWFELELTDHGIARRLQVPYHRVHRFLLDLRRAIAVFEDRSIILLDGEVEVDESYFGPRFENRRRSNRTKPRESGQVLSGHGAQRLEQAVFGIYERTDGIVYVQPVENVSRQTLQSIIHEKVSIETTIYSDAWAAYLGLAKDYAGHETVNHGTSEYVRGSATINGIEGFWAYAKERLLRHHGVSPDHFLLYLKEMEYRFNHRTLDPNDFADHLVQVLLTNVLPRQRLHPLHRLNPGGQFPRPPRSISRLRRLLRELHVPRTNLLGVLPVHPSSDSAWYRSPDGKAKGQWTGRVQWRKGLRRGSWGRSLCPCV